ncbi:sulfite exporter TauE/SafE family protein [Brevibacterium litoralis]|uniref:sulfite exporter TauE/SafE family protein n=1 Tax=Brevibacterium litoralis TaxID=3138935 RepID=UPI0032EFBE1D
MPELEITTLVLLLVAGFAAGWVDAVVGGGGLIQLPALLLVPGVTPIQALAANKVASIMGTSVAALTFARKLRPEPRTYVPLGLAALVGAIVGAMLATFIPEQAFTPVILVVLVGVGTLTLAKPTMGVLTDLRWDGWKHVGGALAIGAGIGLYDGALGPGTGSFFVILLVMVLGYGFMPASALGKIANFCTNLGALIFFVPAGHVLWELGLAVGVANLLGGYVGAKTAMAKGSGFVRVVFIVIVGVLTLKLGWDLVSDLVG